MTEDTEDNPYKGKLMPIRSVEYVASCGTEGCEQEEWSGLALADSGARNRAMKDLRSVGWGTRKGVWMCPEHAGRFPRPLLNAKGES